MREGIRKGFDGAKDILSGFLKKSLIKPTDFNVKEVEVYLLNSDGTKFLSEFGIKQYTLRFTTEVTALDEVKTKFTKEVRDSLGFDVKLRDNMEFINAQDGEEQILLAYKTRNNNDIRVESNYHWVTVDNLPEKAQKLINK